MSNKWGFRHSKSRSVKQESFVEVLNCNESNYCLINMQHATPLASTICIISPSIDQQAVHPYQQPAMTGLNLGGLKVSDLILGSAWKLQSRLCCRSCILPLTFGLTQSFVLWMVWESDHTYLQLKKMKKIRDRITHKSTPSKKIQKTETKVQAGRGRKESQRRWWSSNQWKNVFEEMCMTKLCVCVWQSCVWKMVCVCVTKLCVCVTKLCVWLCDKVACDKMCVKSGVWQSCVCARVCVCVCERWCVTKWCVKGGVWQSCVWKKVCGNDVCGRWCVTKFWDKVVSEKWCVTKLWVTQLCVWEMVWDKVVCA